MAVAEQRLKPKTTRPQLWLGRANSVVRDRKDSTSLARGGSDRRLGLLLGIRGFLEDAGGGDRRLGLLLGFGRPFRSAVGGRLGGRLALLVGALADLEALNRVVRDEVVVDDVAIVRVLGVAVPNGVVVVAVGLAAAAHVELDDHLAPLDLDRRPLLMIPMF